MDRISEHQPSLVFKDKDTGIVHAIELSMLRRIANGQEKITESQTQTLAKIILDRIDDGKRI